MKKFIYLLSASVIVLGSCTNDYDASCFKKNDQNPITNDTISPPKTDSIPGPKTDSIPVVVGPILLKKLVHTYANGNVSTLELLYNDTKIISDQDKSSNLTNYTYTGDVISKIEKTDLSGAVYLTKEYFYENEKVDYVFSYELGNYYKTKYIYNNDGTIFYYKINSDSSKSDLSDTGISGTYTFSEGNLIKEKLNNGSVESVVTYEYDSKNSPRVNILGSDLLIGFNQGFATNNVTKKITQVKNAGVNTFSETISYSYEYDANNFPVKQTQTTQNGSQTTTETSLYSY